ncbi:MAG: hypothetical protein IH790_04195 [Acidobacteria bacterium]|nr:hypothetical protein [Acidobacteriota bacterium]
MLAHRSKLTLTPPFVRFLAIEANSNDKSNELGGTTSSARSLYPLGHVVVYRLLTLKQEQKEKIPLHTECANSGFWQKAQFAVFSRRQFTDYPQIFAHPLKTLFCSAFVSRNLIELGDSQCHKMLGTGSGPLHTWPVTTGEDEYLRKAIQSLDGLFAR